MQNNSNFLTHAFLFFIILIFSITLTFAQVLTFQSPAPVPDGLFGIMPCSPGDLTGDGKSELIFSEIAGTNFTGKVHIFSGADGSLIGTLTSPNPQVDGIFLYTAVISDLTGDTIPEILVGASGEDITQGPTTYYVAGRAYLFNGATGALVHTFEPPTPEDYASFGIRSSEIGDNNGDGTKDILIAQDQTSTTNNINVHIFSGSSFSLLKTLEVPISNTDGDGLTGSISGIIDMNSDGKEDIIIGLPRQRNGSSVKTGAIVIFSSNTGTLIRQINDPDPRDGNWFGTYFKLLPDRNSDGKPEILTAAQEATQAGFSGTKQGVAYILSSADGSVLNTIYTPNPENNGYFGSTVCTMGDLNGDAKDEIVMGSSETYQYSHDGKVYIFSGATLSLITTLHSPTPATEGYFGGVNTVPDIDGDGKNDLLIGAPGEPITYMSDAGKGYLYTTYGGNASVSPASVDFRTHFPDVGPKGPATITLTNTNFGNLTISSPYRITGTNSSEFYTASTPPSLPLAMYESTNIELYFDPDSLGTKSATLEIDTNDPDTPTTTVPLSGEAVEPPYCGLGSMYAKSDLNIVHADPSDGDRTVVLDGFYPYAAPTLIFGLDIYDAYDLVTVTYLTQPTIMKVDRITGTKSIISYTGTPFYEPIAVCVEADKKILVADNNRGLLRLDPATGNVSTLNAGVPGWHPGSMDLEADGDIVIADTNNYMILKFNPVNGALSIVPGPFILISHIAVLPDGDYVATGSASNLYISPIVYRVNPTTGAKTLISGDGVGSGITFLDEDMSVAIDPSGNIIVFDSVREALFQVDSTTGNRTVISSNGQGVGSGPDLLNGGTHNYFTHLAIDTTGTPVSVNESSWNLYN